MPDAPRRSFLKGALSAGVGAAAAGAAGYALHGTPAAAAAVPAAGFLPPVPFHGKHQAGIAPTSQNQTAVISFAATADGRAEPTNLFQTRTRRSRFPPEG